MTTAKIDRAELGRAAKICRAELESWTPEHRARFAAMWDLPFDQLVQLMFFLGTFEDVP